MVWYDVEEMGMRMKGREGGEREGGGGVNKRRQENNGEQK